MTFCISLAHFGQSFMYGVLPFLPLLWSGNQVLIPEPPGLPPPGWGTGSGYALRRNSSATA